MSFRQIFAAIPLTLGLLAGCGSEGGVDASSTGAGGSGGSGVSATSGTGAPSCTKADCEAGACGVKVDGCGSTVACGECPLIPDGTGTKPPTCGGDGANRCGPNACTPVDCAALGATCGLVSDGCADVLDCGACPEGLACGTNNKCESSSSSGSPSASTGTGDPSGPTSTGAGDPAGATGATGSASGGCVPQCSAASSCETVPDGCGGQVQCGCFGCATVGCDGQNCGCPTRFGDDASLGPFADDIRCMAGKCIINGKACGGANGPCDGVHPTNFAPGHPTTRGQLAKIISRSAKFSDPVSGQTFVDVPPSHIFYAYIERLAKRGIISGYSCGTNCMEFRPNNPITRGQGAKIIAGSLNVPLANADFADVPPGHTFYKQIGALQAAGYVQGKNSCLTSSCSGKCFCPGDEFRRDQIAAVVARVIDCPSYCPDPGSL